MSVTIAPLRLLLLCFILLLVWPLAAIAVSFRSPEDEKEPLTGWRKLLRPIVVFLCRCVFFVGGFYWVSVKGKRAQPEEAPILAVAPHSSYLDALPASVCLDLDSIVGKHAAQCVPLFGIDLVIEFWEWQNWELLVLFMGLWCLTSSGWERRPYITSNNSLVRFTQPVFVKREDPDSRQNTIKEIKRRAASGGKWPQIIIFPEGTCTNRTCLISYKLGAFYPGVPVQPVCIKYPNRLDTVTWTWEGPGALPLLWLTLCQFNTNAEIEFLPVYTPNEEEKADPKLFANNVRNEMAKALGVPITDHTFDDCRLMMEARKLNLPMEAGLVEFQKLHKKLGVSLEQLQEWLEDFSQMNLRHKGHVTLEEFSHYLQVPESDSLKDVFTLYDRDGSGSIDFREYVIGLSLVSQPVNTESTISLAFQMFAGEGQGYISHGDLHQILHNAFGMTEVDTRDLFSQVDQDEDGKITYDEFKVFAEQKPEYAPLFLTYRDSRMADSDENTSSNAKLPTVSEETSSHPKSE